MKTKLLKKLRREGWNKITVYSITTTRGLVTGMSYGISGEEYRGIFSLGDTEEDVHYKAMMIYMRKEIERLKYKRKNKSL